MDKRADLQVQQSEPPGHCDLQMDAHKHATGLNCGYARNIQCRLGHQQGTTIKLTWSISKELTQIHKRRCIRGDLKSKETLAKTQAKGEGEDKCQAKALIRHSPRR